MLRRLDPATFRRVPWANGLGLTTEIARSDDETGAMLWRISIADVVEAGPFSVLPGIDRIITLIEGEGFDLDCGVQGGVLPLKPFEPVTFSGDWPTAAIDFRGPSRDLNVMTARGQIEAAVQVLRDGAAALRLDHGPHAAFMLLFAGAGVLHVGDEPHALQAGEGLCCDNIELSSLTFRGESAARLAIVTLN